MKVNILFISVVLLTGLISCQRVIDVSVSNASPKLVIEGNITDHVGPQTVTLSQSVAYSNTNIFPPVSGAIITLNESSGVTYKLTETTPGTYVVNNIKGKTANLYILTVVLKGQTYTGASIMPAAVPLDSLTVIGQVFGSKTIKTVVANFHDPAGVSNQYRFVMYVNSVQVKAIFVENDQFSDGRDITSALYEQDIDLKTGDKVDVDMQCIDPTIYNYWENLSNQGGNSPQNSATPSNPTSNINNNALGYFSAHTIQRKSIIIP